MKESVLKQIRDLTQEDVCRRGLRADSERNLINACPGDFAAACESLAYHPHPVVGIVTGFFIPDGQPAAGETDGPLGAVFLARALSPLGYRIVIFTDPFCRAALAAGLRACQLEGSVSLLTLPTIREHWPQFLKEGWTRFAHRIGLTHLIAIERPGPSHTMLSFQLQVDSRNVSESAHLEFLRDVPQENQNRYYTASGIDVTHFHSPAELLFEFSRRELPDVVSIGIGDGGNEIGMGKISWDVIRRNIPGGGKIACRIPADYLLVCGVSNWGAYGLAAGVRILREESFSESDFTAEQERLLLQSMVEKGPLIDGLLKVPSLSVDGLSFDRYIQPLLEIIKLARRAKGV